ncbi:hypothetical protein E5F05_17860 [Deinococcus metallilatus]|uniref:Uncharacterized protein n=1 Tax=Deinococcus metallilatus TaxID=1211322 RepID=A0AAJ5F112_9DEIO|nr:hypothetical protein [Deinococcus metallilatus]MBB5297490.1 hypothetical protein [Deinococcus metallilatus]QBY09638.1 hypothetical protein E5F05_17860 [Deinococcus metallilatus]RXJ09067.1 hypothetical protein ERJ73_16705 [Deinococcus metallilatus]TLK20452.1 hypothetical protein FCS05_20125 [Deinococcus metallilatus]
MSSPVAPPTRRPPRLAFLTVPLMIGLIYNAISLLTLPFSGDTLNTLLGELGAASGQPPVTLSQAQIMTVLWLSFFLTAGLILLLYFTRRAVLEGRSWGRVASIVIAVLSLLLFPVGTVLGIIMLIGAFDRDVQAYTSR